MESYAGPTSTSPLLRDGSSAAPRDSSAALYATAVGAKPAGHRGDGGGGGAGAASPAGVTLGSLASGGSPGDADSIYSSNRLLDRSSAFHQSLGTYNKVALGNANKWSRWKLRLQDLFHTLLELSTMQVTFVVSCMYFAVFLIYAALYLIVGVRHECNADFHTFQAAFLFSVETSMTIGYGASDPFFKGCVSMSILISTEAVAGSLLDAICVGLLYARLSAASSRAHAILFSNKAVIRRVDGQWAFQVRVCDLSGHAASDCSVRVVAVRHQLRSPDGPTDYFDIENMRVHQPNDELGAQLLLILPQVVTHAIYSVATDSTNPRSPLLPTHEYLTKWQKQVARDLRRQSVRAAAAASRAPGSSAAAAPASIDESRADDGGDDHGEHGIMAPDTRAMLDTLADAGDSAATDPASPSPVDRARRNWSRARFLVKASHVGSKRVGANIESGINRRGLPIVPEGQGAGEFNESELQRFWRESEMEVLVLVEGTDGLTSDTFQARHSYTINDVEFDQDFAPCVSRQPGKAASIDFDAFHNVVAADADDNV